MTEQGAAAERKAEQTEGAASTTAELDVCADEESPSPRMLETGDSRLHVGLGGGKYGDLVGAASVSDGRSMPAR